MIAWLGADLSLEDKEEDGKHVEGMLSKAKRFGYDGVELACWGDHFEVDKADSGYCAAKRDLLDKHGLKYYSISTHLVGLAVLVVLVPVLAIRGPHVDLDRFPIDAVNAMEDELGLSPSDHRVVHQDFVGNYLDLRYGDAGASWIDDRFELHDLELVEDYLALLNGTPEWADVLERHDPDAVLWPADRVLVELATDDEWAIAWSDDDWVVLTPPSAEE